MLTRFNQLAFACFLFVTCSPALVFGQAFQNLDFETVLYNYQPLPPNNVFGAVASVPGWTFSEFNPPQLAPHLSSQPQQFLLTDNFGFGPPFYLGAPVQGHYSVSFQEGYYFPNTTQIGPGVSQTGMIPAGTKSVRFYGAGGFLGGLENLWNVTINGNPVPTKRFANGTYLGEPAYTGQISADVSAYAGTTAMLKIALDPTNDLPIGPLFVNETKGVLDAVRFSPLEYTIVPEPANGVVALGLVVSLALKRRRNSVAVNS